MKDKIISGEFSILDALISKYGENADIDALRATFNHEEIEYHQSNLVESIINVYTNMCEEDKMKKLYNYINNYIDENDLPMDVFIGNEFIEVVVLKFRGETEGVEETDSVFIIEKDNGFSIKYVSPEGEEVSSFAQSDEYVCKECVYLLGL